MPTSNYPTLYLPHTHLYTYTYTYVWPTSPKHGTPPPTHTTLQPPKFTNILPPKYPLTQSYHTNDAFTPLDGQGKGNIAGSGVFNAPLAINIATKLLGFPNILRGELYTLLLAIEHTTKLTMDTSNLHLRP